MIVDMKRVGHEADHTIHTQSQVDLGIVINNLTTTVTQGFIFHSPVLTLLRPFVSSTILSLPKCGKGKPALVRRNTVDDKSELIACIETGNFAKAARIAAGKSASPPNVTHETNWLLSQFTAPLLTSSLFAFHSLTLWFHLCLYLEGTNTFKP